MVVPFFVSQRKDRGVRVFGCFPATDEMPSADAGGMVRSPSWSTAFSRYPQTTTSLVRRKAVKGNPIDGCLLCCCYCSSLGREPDNSSKMNCTGCSSPGCTCMTSRREVTGLGDIDFNFSPLLSTSFRPSDKSLRNLYCAWRYTTASSARFVEP